MPNTELPPRLEVQALDLPDTPEAWLAQLEDFTLIRLCGRDPSRLRIVSVLLHGNEPSSIRGLHRLLHEGRRPETDVWVLVGAVRAAVGPPLFGARYLAEDGDMNRCWAEPAPGDTGPRAQRIAQLRAWLEGCGAEAMVDVHNNTGHNPPYGVGPLDTPQAVGLAALFGERYVHTPITMGTLMEVTAPLFPSVAIECGRSGDPAADDVAYRGLRDYLQRASLDDLPALAAKVTVLRDPIRVLIKPGTRLRFGHEAHPDADLTLDPNIDRHNFQPVVPGELLGWLAADEIPLSAHDGQGVDRSREMFERHGRELRVGNTWIPVMMTTSPSAALSDCLFYAVHRRAKS